MKVMINKLQYELPLGASLADAISVIQPASPFAAAINRQFVPKTSYSQTRLQPDDDVEIIRPVTGG